MTNFCNEYDELEPEGLNGFLNDWDRDIDKKTVNSIISDCGECKQMVTMADAGLCFDNLCPFNSKPYL